MKGERTTECYELAAPIKHSSHGLDVLFADSPIHNIVEMFMVL